MTSGAHAQPFYLHENFAPVGEETTAFDLPVTGELPASLDGLLVRNGPNPVGGDPGHWFLGDGMLHGVRIARGRAEWYRNRWIRTRYLTEHEPRLATLTGRMDHTVAKANTHVVAHAGRLLALVESSFPTEVDGELETLGTTDFGGALTGAFTAHPKRCPRTGELHFFGYALRRPYLVYHVLDAAGRLVRSLPVATRGPTLMHDFALTSCHVLFLDLPIVLDRIGALLRRASLPFRWSARHGARIGILPRGAKSDRTRWLEIEPCFVFHVLNAYEAGPGITLDVVRYERLWRRHAHDFPPAHLHRYCIDLSSGRISDARLDDRPVEFPRLDPRRESLPNRFGYAVETVGTDVPAGTTRLHRYDLETMDVATHDFGPGRVPSEPVFVPAAPDGAEDEGWVLTYVHDAARGASDLAVLDASRIDGPPLALVHLPARVPNGFHGNWIADGELGAAPVS